MRTNDKAIVVAEAGKVSKMKRMGMILAMGIISVVPALATDPPADNDYTGSLTAFKDSMTGFFSTNGPLLLGALVVMLGFGIVWKLVKRAAKSV